MDSASAVGIWGALEQADMNATLAINSLHSPASDAVWAVFSDKEIWYPLYLLVLVFLIVRLGWKKALVVTLSCVLTIVICDQLANFTKEFFGRLRPCWDERMLAAGLHEIGGKSEYYKFGFYSAHAANAFGFAVCSWLGFRNDTRLRWRGYGCGICLWGFLVGLSRIFAGQHFLGDVLVGLLVGALAGWAMAALARLAFRRFRL